MPTLYELLYIIPATFTDEEVGTVETKVNALLTKYEGTVESTKRLGKMRFAYPIKNQRFGHYVLVMLKAEKSAIGKIETNLRITNEVLRHILLNAEDAGSDQKYDLIQFAEVNVEQKEDRPRRRDKVEAKEGTKAGQEIKEGVAALTEPKEEAPATETLSAVELDKKIETALSEDVKEV